MTKSKALGALMILSAVFAAPAFARSATGPHYGLESQTSANFYGAYNQSGAPFDARPLTNEERRNVEDFGFSGRDPSRVGGENPYLHPAS
jgi:hypothetical protein